MGRVDPAIIADAELVRQARDGSRLAFTQLVRRHQGWAMVVARGMVGQPADAEDVVQEAFILAYCRLAQLADPDRFPRWLRGIVRSQAQTWRRRHAGPYSSLINLDQSPAVEPDKAPSHDPSPAKDQLWQAMTRLPEKLREPLALRYLNQLTVQQIADYCDLPASTVKGRLELARARLRFDLDKMIPKEPAMTQDTVEHAIAETLCRLARQTLHQTLPLDGRRNVVLYCGIPGEIELCHTQGQDVLVTGDKAALGLDEQDAQASVERIELLADYVEDYLASGPHAGEIFWGTITDDQDRPIATPANSRQRWLDKGGTRGDWPTFQHESLYPELRPNDPRLDHLPSEQMAHATRISLLQHPPTDIVLPRQALTPTVQRVFRANWTRNEQVHGPRGYARLVVAVPEGVSVTVIALPHLATQVKVTDWRSPLTIAGGTDLELSHLTGNVHLLQCSVRLASDVQGQFLWSRYDLGGCSTPGHMLERIETTKTLLRNIHGQVRIDLAKLDLDIGDMTGDVQVRNRFGSTRYRQTGPWENTKVRLEADSGRIKLMVSEQCLTEARISAVTLCGPISFDSIHGRTANDLQLARFSTTDPRQDLEKSDILIRTRDGAIVMEAISSTPE
ncbi:MAG: sigma-70 family RNA polymerase sigma factor [Phycisphaeraceae bacterium]|nr:sigma-70 family RNA polymerase sigma factor [Phycisphaeraceae bacterium]